MTIDEVIDKKVEDISIVELYEIFKDEIPEYESYIKDETEMDTVLRKRYQEKLIDTLPEWINESDVEDDGQ